MFDRKEAILKAYHDKSIEVNTLILMTDFYYMKGKLTQEEYDEIMGVLAPPEEPA